MSTSGGGGGGNIISTLGDVQYIGRYHEYVGGYHEYIGDIMMHVGEKVGKNLSISIENPDVLKSPDVLMTSSQCTHDISPMYSWYPSDVLNIP